MLLIRRFEEQCERLYMDGKIRGFLHLYIGEEAIAVGALSNLRDDDYIITHYRDHGHALARGMAPNAVMAELMGKVTGTSGGKGGSMHLFDVEKGFMGGHAIVGGHLPIAVGLALAIKYRGGDQVVVCFFGDGAVNQGEFHESLNLASLWGLPVLFFLENNLYGMGTHVDRTHAGGRDIFQSADTYEIPAAQVDGMDVLAVWEATLEAVQRVRGDGGPVFLEAMTYRFQGPLGRRPDGLPRLGRGRGVARQGPHRPVRQARPGAGLARRPGHRPTGSGCRRDRSRGGALRRGERRAAPGGVVQPCLRLSPCTHHG